MFVRVDTANEKETMWQKAKNSWGSGVAGELKWRWGPAEVWQQQTW